MESDCFESDVLERVIPTENIQLMFHYRNPFLVYDQNTTFKKQPRSIISGLSNSFTDVSTCGEAGVVFVSFYPAGACHFFNFPLSEIENQSIDMTSITKDVSLVEELLFTAHTVKQKISVIEKFLLDRYTPVPVHDSLLVQKGVRLIKESKGNVHAASLADQLATTPKTLERKFSHYLGKTTKQMIKLFRFQGVLEDFSTNKTLNLADHAVNNGYFDQSHFIHDFKKFCGYTPGEFVSRYPDFDLYSESG
ncbi:MAG: AraC family transcriptional regulator [Fibrobacter sp.]|nr:AraC family transcriptional regulator [Fibrobacter sp.]